jgi:hypothetical protein
MTHKVNTVEEGRKRIAESLNNGTALEKFKQMLIKQNIDEMIADGICYGRTIAILPMAKHETKIKSQSSGILKSLILILIPYDGHYLNSLFYFILNNRFHTDNLSNFFTRIY